MKDTNFFITKAKEIHRDKYDYSKSVYSGGHKKLIVVCRIHGDFLIRPHNHYRGQGCPQCYSKQFDFKIPSEPNSSRRYRRNEAKRDKKKDTKNRKILIWAKKLKLVNEMGDCCSYCGEKRLWALCFHHQNPDLKEYSITNLIARKARFEDLVKEAHKCLLVCHNCHRGFHPLKSESSILNKKLCLDYKNGHNCTKCDYSKNINALEFHHEDETKKFKISKYIVDKKWKCIDDIDPIVKKELNKCTVLCRNCHQEIHTDIEFFFQNEKEIIGKSIFYEAKNKLDETKILELKNQGLNRFEIATNLKCSPCRIYEILQSYKGEIA
jgi:hypothetical protein